jgi:hypothetical protein
MPALRRTGVCCLCRSITDGRGRDGFFRCAHHGDRRVRVIAPAGGVAAARDRIGLSEDHVSASVEQVRRWRDGGMLFAMPWSAL